MSPQFIRSNNVVTSAGVRPACVRIEDGRFTQIAPTSGREQIRDFGDLFILPGLVDTHVHINDPGRADWEGFHTATRAAAAGGYTTVVDMPLNCLPETTTVEALLAKREAANGKCWVDWAAWGGVIAANKDHIEPLAAEGVPGFKCFLIYPGCEGFTMVDEPQLRAALPHVARTGLPLLVHAELAGPIQAAVTRTERMDWEQYRTYLTSRPSEAEVAAINLMIQLCREYGVRIHIVHLSAAEALPMLGDARAEGLPITVETCPHYLHFAAEHIPDGATLFKCAPPIRDGANQEQLWQALRDGVIDLVATDHSPCPPNMKGMEEGNFQTAWGGIASLSVSLSAMWTEARSRGFALAHLARWMAEAPAELAGFEGRKGRIAEGCDADFVVFDPEARHRISADRLYFKHPVSPYVGEDLYGEVKATFVRGVKVFEDGQFLGRPIGRELRR